MFENEYIQTQHAFRSACKVSLTAELWYGRLWQAYHNLEYKLHTPYNGLMLTSIFDAKAVAFRARAVDQIDFQFHVPEIPIEVDSPDDDALHAYYTAYLVEKDAWSLYHANYCVLALSACKTWPQYNVWCSDTGRRPAHRNDDKFTTFAAGKIRTLEVKQVK